MDLSIYLSTYLSSYLSISLSLSLSTCLLHYLSIYLAVSVYLSVCLSVYLSVYLSICLSAYPSISVSVFLSVYLSIYLSIRLFLFLSFYLSVYLQASKRSDSARLRPVSKLATSKTKQFLETFFSKTRQPQKQSNCQTSPIFDANDINDKKRSNSARLPSEMESRAPSCGPRSYEVLHLLRKIILAHLKI